MNKLLESKPAPDFAELERVLKGEQAPRKVHQVELLIDDEILQAVSEQVLNEPFPTRGDQPRWMPMPTEIGQAYYRQYVRVFVRLGYDFVPISRLYANHPPQRKRRADDTAALSRGQREWVEEGTGIIASRADFEQFPWEEIEPDYTPVEFAAAYLPDGMKMTVMATLYQHVVDALLGHEGLFYMMRDDPELVEEIFERWGQKVYDYYAGVIDTPEVGAIFHADDLAYRTSTMISPADLRRLVFPWFSKYVDLAHRHGKMFLYHGCGNVYVNDVIDDLIDDVHIDGFHSFQDLILPVTQFKKTYGNRTATLGGVDMHKLVTLEEEELRTYLRGILDECMPNGRYAFGTGNTVANYVPLKNYFVLLDEGRRWSSTMLS